jgi:hypothetical protein
MRDKLSKRKIAFFSLAIIILVALLFLCRDPLNALYHSVTYQIRFGKEISFCKSVANDEVQFRYVRIPQSGVKQIVFEVRESTSWEDVASVVTKVSEYYKQRTDGDEIWQIVLSKGVSKEYPVGYIPYAIFTNQMAISEMISNEETCLHICRLDETSSWDLSHLEGSRFDFVEELVLCGSFEDLDPLKNWNGLSLCAYATGEYCTYRISQEFPNLSEEVWERLCAQMDDAIQFVPLTNSKIEKPKLGATYL